MEHPSMTFFYDIRSADNTLLKRDGALPPKTPRTAGRQDAKKMKNMRQPDSPDVGRIMAGGAPFGTVLIFRVGGWPRL
jgi:hypothetical protein